MTGARTPQEIAADEAWTAYLAAHEDALGAANDPTIPSHIRRSRHERAIRAYREFEDAFHRIGERAPLTSLQRRNRLSCEAIVLAIAIGAFLLTFLPGLEAEGWPLTVAFLLAFVLGGWAFDFTGRLALYVGGRS